MRNKPLTMIVYGFCMIWRIRQMEEGVCANVWVVIQKCIPTVNSIASAMDNRDTIDHHILLNKLYHYGIRGHSFSWVSSYLTNRKQLVQFTLACCQPGPIVCVFPKDQF